MNKTNLLRQLIQTRLLQLGTEVYYRLAKDDAMYPHIVFELTGADTSDDYRTDFTLAVDVYTKKDQAKAYELTDSMDQIFRNLNDPQEKILPTFYLETRSDVDDNDKDIKRVFSRYEVQVYERS